ncbi:MAG: STAS domain-containing protein [Bacteroidales bacterium]|nr:STAS domain-containing protein [Bacteroidales bacterium]
MFSAGYFNRAMIINAVGTQHINCHDVEKFRHLVIQLLKNPCGKIILDFEGITQIDLPAIAVIERLCGLALKQHVIIEFANLNTELKKLFDTGNFALPPAELQTEPGV